MTIAESARIYAWTEALDELSGLEAGDDAWVAEDSLPDTVRDLLGEVGRFHAPFLLANAAALEKGADQVETEIAGRPWVPPPFPDQRKCLGWLRESYGGLDAASRSTVDGLLSGTGCETLFE